MKLSTLALSALVSVSMHATAQTAPQKPGSATHKPAVTSKDKKKKAAAKEKMLKELVKKMRAQ
jgi:hypothetical protein